MNPELILMAILGALVVGSLVAGFLLARWLSNRLGEANDDADPIEDTVSDSEPRGSEAETDLELGPDDATDADVAASLPATIDDAGDDGEEDDTGDDASDESAGADEGDGEDTDTDTSTVRDRLAAVSDQLHRTPGRVLAAVQRVLFGSAQSYTTRIASFVMLLSAIVVGAGAWTAATSGLDASGGSGFIVELVISAATSLWSYAVIVALIAAMLTVLRDRRLASITASKTGLSAKTVRRLAAEGRSTDGCTTVVVGPSDSIIEITNRVLDAMSLDPIDADHDVFRYMEGVTEPGPAKPDGHDPDPPTTADGDPDDPSVGDRFTQARLELASAISFRDVLWRFAMPALATFVALLVVVQLWVAIWVYPILAAAAVLVGAAVYQYTGWRRRRRLRALRSPEESRPWSDIATMVKRVDTKDTTLYYAWVAGHRYVDYDAARLAATVARSAHAHVHDEDVPPALQQKFARNVRQYVPNLRGYEANVEKPEIMDVLGDEVAREDHDILPKHRLAERVIRRDRDTVGGVGYDPRVVAECYDRMVPYALVEVPIEVTTGAGDTVEMPAVKLRTTEIPPEKARTEAEFSTTFNPAADPEFDLPDVDHHHSLPDASFDATL